MYTPCHCGSNCDYFGRKDKIPCDGVTHAYDEVEAWDWEWLHTCEAHEQELVYGEEPANLA